VGFKICGFLWFFFGVFVGFLWHLSIFAGFQKKNCLSGIRWEVLDSLLLDLPNRVGSTTHCPQFSSICPPFATQKAKKIIFSWLLELLTWNLSFPEPVPPPVKLFESIVVTAVMLSYTESYLKTTLKRFLEPDKLTRFIIMRISLAELQRDTGSSLKY